jgi:sugar lactone lactonase YvrE
VQAGLATSPEDYAWSSARQRRPSAETNLAFAGQDGKTLYITTHSSLFQVRMLAQRYQGRAK